MKDVIKLLIILICYVSFMIFVVFVNDENIAHPGRTATITVSDNSGHSTAFHVRYEN